MKEHPLQLEIMLTLTLRPASSYFNKGHEGLNSKQKKKLYF